MKIQILEIEKITSGGLHCWCKSNIGRIRKPNYAVPKYFFEREEIPRIEEIKILKWYQRFWNWIKKFMLI